ncbi:adenine phosphoribosyltransferase [Batrachochytrium salamandrivorans]|nr:adenine phosphoribosyltransferase [Batrachochytrium salamandrivorans]
MLAAVGGAVGITVLLLAVRSRRPKQAVLVLGDGHAGVREGDYELVQSLIASHYDFPQVGILFRDAFPVFQHPSAFAALLRLFKAHLDQAATDIDVIIGLDARGFLLGPILAGMLNCAFSPVRKSGKLPGELVSVKYEKEYGADEFAIPVGAVRAGQRVLVVDDLLATGGTLEAACELVRQLGGEFSLQLLNALPVLFHLTVVSLLSKEQKLALPDSSILTKVKVCLLRFQTYQGAGGLQIVKRDKDGFLQMFQLLLVRGKLGLVLCNDQLQSLLCSLQGCLAFPVHFFFVWK